MAEYGSANTPTLSLAQVIRAFRRLPSASSASFVVLVLVLVLVLVVVLLLLLLMLRLCCSITLGCLAVLRAERSLRIVAKEACDLLMCLCGCGVDGRE